MITIPKEWKSKGYSSYPLPPIKDYREEKFLKKMENYTQKAHFLSSKLPNNLKPSMSEPVFRKKVDEVLGRIPPVPLFTIN